jgi:MoaA/NifB/PqqE/SkfB family radical SAM enzyme
MINIDEVREVHLELSTNCNASCPLCPRNYFGYPYNAGYPDTELSLDNIKTIFSPEFIAQLRVIRFNGNLGDFMLARDGLAITAYFRQHNPTARIDISTNGSARTTAFWSELAQYNPVVRFALDGLEDTHHLYRQNTNFHTVLKNAQAFIDAGGTASWKMVLFDHNRHQVDAARAMSQDLGFAEFELVDHGRDDGPVFDRDGNITHTIGSRWPKPQENVVFYLNRQKEHGNKKRYLIQDAPGSTPINCVTKGPRKTIYIAANGEVYPCCWTGFYPRTFDPDLHYGNDRIKELLGDFDNNALHRPLAECLSWFNRIEQAHAIESWQQGRPFICSRECGQR